MRPGRTRTWLLRAIGPAALLLLLWRIDPRQVVAVLSRGQPAVLAAALVLLLPIHLVRSLRWRALVARQGVELGVAEAATIYAHGLLLGVVTPGRLGELTKAAHLSRRGMSGRDGLTTVIVDRLLDLLTVAATAAAFLPLAGLAPGAGPTAVLAVLVVGVGLALLALVHEPWWRSLAGAVAAVSPRAWRANLEREVELLGTSIRRFGPRVLVGGLGWSFLASGVNWAMIVLLARSLGLTPPIGAVVAAAATSAAISALPISILGMGTRDAVFVLVFGRLGIPPAGAVALSALVLLSMLAYALLAAYSLLTPVGRWEPPR